MGLDFNEFISVERHYKKVEREAQEVRDKYVVTAQSRWYLLDLFDFFLNDIKKAAEVIYTEVLHKKDSLGKRFIFTSSDLKLCIESGTCSLLPLYNRIISGYNMGGMFRDVDDFQKLKDSFNEDAEALCKKQAEVHKNQYLKLTAKNRREYWTFIGAVGGMFIGIASVVGFKITLDFAAGFSFIKSVAQNLARAFC